MALYEHHHKQFVEIFGPQWQLIEEAAIIFLNSHQLRLKSGGRYWMMQTKSRYFFLKVKVKPFKVRDLICENFLLIFIMHIF